MHYWELWFSTLLSFLNSEHYQFDRSVFHSLNVVKLHQMPLLIYINVGLFQLSALCYLTYIPWLLLPYHKLSSDLTLALSKHSKCCSPKSVSVSFFFLFPVQGFWNAKCQLKRLGGFSILLCYWIKFCLSNNVDSCEMLWFVITKINIWREAGTRKFTVAISVYCDTLLNSVMFLKKKNTHRLTTELEL